MESKRQQKFSRLIQKELGYIFQRDGKSYFSDNMISVTKVDMSPDLSVAKVYLSLVIQRDKDKMMELVDRKKSEIRKDLGNRIGKQVRRIPELIFYLDDSAAYADKMDQLFRNLDIPEEDNSDKDIEE
ncbi:MAG TPA: 30S ribosome-binding factor RbfA [Cytophagales bacterium]|jgi:ribosome-binding factor A|nr:30S ribosome-binding factor RbfA [Cytophagales bacterium]